MRWFTPEEFAFDIQMERAHYRGVLVLVEGSTDARFYKRLFIDGSCGVIPVDANKDKPAQEAKRRRDFADEQALYSAKSLALGALAILEKNPKIGDRVLAIVDSDFDVLEGINCVSRNHFRTDSHDLETMLLQSPALEKYLEHYGSPEKIAKFTALAGKEVRQALVESGLPLGYLKWVNMREGLGLKFKPGKDEKSGLAYHKFLTVTLVVDTPKMIKTVKDYSQKPHLHEADLQTSMETLHDPSHDPWQVCTGRHLIETLAHGLRHIFGSEDMSTVRPEIVETNLTLAYEASWFTTTHLHAALQQWQADHPPYRILPTPALA